MKEKKGNIPVDTQIVVDYSEKEPKINFKYPEKNAYEQNKLGYHSLILMIILLGIPALCMFIPLDKELPNSCEVKYGVINGTETVDLVIMECENGRYELVSSKRTLLLNKIGGVEVVGFYEKENSLEMMIGALKIFGGWIILLIIFLIINKKLTKFLIKNKWYIKNIPKINAFSLDGKVKYRKFTRKDVDDDGLLIIPCFDNVMLNYKAEKEFGEHLVRIEILHDDFSYQMYRKGKKIKKKWWVKRNWYAIFVFKDYPKKGKLEVWFK